MWRPDDEIRADLGSHEPERIAAALADLIDAMDGHDEIAVPPLDAAVLAVFGEPAPEVQRRLARLITTYRGFEPSLEAAARRLRLLDLALAYGDRSVAFDAAMQVKIGAAAAEIHALLEHLARHPRSTAAVRAGAAYFVSCLLDGEPAVRAATVHALAASRDALREVIDAIVPELEPVECAAVRPLARGHTPCFRHVPSRDGQRDPSARPEPIFGLAICDEGRRAVTSPMHGPLRSWDVERACVLAGADDLVWSASLLGIRGRWVAVGEDSSPYAVSRWDLETLRLDRRVAGTCSERLGNAVVDPTGRRAVVGVTETAHALTDHRIGRFLWLDLDTGEAGAPVPVIDDGRMGPIALGPDGQVAAAGDGVQVWAGGAPRTLADRGEFVWLAFHPDGRHLLGADDEHAIRIWDLDSGRLIRSLIGHRDRVWRHRLSPDGRTLATASWDDSVKLWDLHSGAGETVLTLSDSPAGLAFDPSGRFLLASRRELRAYDRDTRRELAPWASAHGIREVVVARARRVVYGDEHGNVVFLDLET